MKIVIVTTFLYDVIEVPFEDSKTIKGMIKKFDKFIHNKNNDHPFWIYKDNAKYGSIVNTDTLVWWLNNIYLDNGKTVTIISRENDLSMLDKYNKNDIVYL